MAGPWEDFQSEAQTVETAGPWSDFEAASVAAPVEPGFLDRVGKRIAQRDVNLERALDAPSSEDVVTTLTKTPRRALRVAGQMIGGLNDIIGEGAVSLYRATVDKPLRESFERDIMESPVMQLGLKALKAGGEVYQKFKERFPEAAFDLESSGNIAAFMPIGVGAGVAKAGASEAVNIGKDVISAMASPVALEKKLASTIEKGIEKGIRPSVVGKGTSTLRDRYIKKAQNAVEAIVENKDKLALTDEAGEVIVGQLPQNLKQFGQAITQAKKVIFDEYDSLAKAAGDQGVKVDLAPVAKELSSIAEKTTVQDVAPNVAKYATDKAEIFGKRGSYTAQEAQDAIALYNQNLEAFYKNPTYEAARQVYVDSLIANMLRKSLDDAIEGATSGGYQGLKNAYGSLKAIEKEVNQRAVVDARKNPGGIFDMTDVVSGGAVVHGIVSLNPATFAAGVAGEAIKKTWKFWNDPNRHVRNMFQDAETLMRKRGESGTLQSDTMRRQFTDLEGMLTPPDMPTLRPAPVPAGPAPSSPYSPELGARLYSLKGVPQITDVPESMRATMDLRPVPQGAPYSTAIPNRLYDIRNEVLSAQNPYAGTVPKLPLEEWNPELAAKLQEFLNRGRDAR